MMTSHTTAPCAIVVPYFDNPDMLAHQVSVWNTYSDELAGRLQFVIVDDCSSRPALPIVRDLRHDRMLLRFEERFAWNQHQARNLGAMLAQPRANGDSFWLYLSDVDIVLTADAAYTMLSRDLDVAFHYTVERVFAPDLVHRKVHPNTFLCTRDAFWRVGGYDCDLIPVGGGGYGGDSEFARQLAAVCPRRHLDDVLTIGYGRRTRVGRPAVIADADTLSLDRDEWARRYREAYARKLALGDMRPRDPVRTPWQRLL